MISIIALLFTRNVINLLTVNLQIWIFSFQDSLGLDDAEMKRIWQETTLIANICALPIIIISGRLADRFSAKVMGPLFLVIQIIMCSSYYFVKEPNTAFAYILAIFLNGVGSAVIVILQGYAVKRVPKMIRGITMAFMIAVASTGGIIYLQITKLFYTTAPWMIFVTVAILDIPILLLLLIAIYCG